MGTKSARALLALTLLASTTVLGVVTAPPSLAAGTFDDDDGNTHEAMIELIAARGITEGCNAAGNLYCPERTVNRGQMASFLVRALEDQGIPIPSDVDDAFDDDDGTTHEDNINVLAAMGVVTGGTDGRYRPNASVTRGQMALFLHRAFSLPDATGDRFSDVPEIYRNEANALAEAEITLGCDAAGTQYCPGDPVRRDQMASFIGRAISRDDAPEPGTEPPTGPPSPPGTPPGPPPGPLPTSSATAADGTASAAAVHATNVNGSIACWNRYFELSGPALDTPDPNVYYWVSEVYLWTTSGWQAVATGPGMWKRGGDRGWFYWGTSEMISTQQWNTTGGYFTSVDHLWHSSTNGNSWVYDGGYLPTHPVNGYWCQT